MSNSWTEKLIKALPWIGVLALQMVNAGNSLITKRALSHGMQFSVLACFRNAIASIALLPVVIIQRNSLPNMTMGLFLQILALGVLEPGLDQNFLYAGLKKTPASVSSCMVGVCPALTFIGSWIFGLETVRVNQRRSQAKILGTIIMAGAGILIGLYNGPTVVVSSSSHSELAGDAIEGSLYVSIAVLAYVSYNILMGKVVMQYPAPLALTAFICLIGAVIDTGVALTLEIRRGVSWSIGWNIELLSYFYSGLIVSALSSYIQSMLIKSKGPVFVTSFNPVSMILVILLALVTVGENLYLGRVIGVILLMGGLFTLLWGKSGEEHI